MTSVIERCHLAPDLSVSRVVHGLWQIADMERGGGQLDRQQTAAAMKPYVDAGFTTFDMADHYGSAEQIAGAFRAEHGADAAQLLTKWVPTPGPLTKDDVRAAVTRSLERMQSDRIDLLQYHAWVYADPAWLDGLFWLREIQQEGLVRHIGLTNVDTAHLRIVLETGIDVVSNQVCFSLIDRRALGGMTDLCRQHRVKLLAFGTVGGGLLTERWVGKPEPTVDDMESWSLMKYKRFVDAAGGWDVFQELLATVERIAKRRKVSMANIACRYVLDQESVGGVIIGARLGERDHIQDTRRLFDFSLDETDRGELDEAAAQLGPIPGDCGDEYRREPFLTASGDLSHHVESFPAPYEVAVGDDGRSRATSGTPWEAMAGYSRAVRAGNRIMVSGTTATHGDRVIGGTDAAAQTHFVIDKIEGALLSLGSRLADVVRTRVFVQRVEDWEAVARVHGERFGDTLPANTLVQATLIGDEYLVEMEAEAIVDRA